MALAESVIAVNLGPSVHQASLQMHDRPKKKDEWHRPQRCSPTNPPACRNPRVGSHRFHPSRAVSASSRLITLTFFQESGLLDRSMNGCAGDGILYRRRMAKPPPSGPDVSRKMCSYTSDRESPSRSFPVPRRIPEETERPCLAPRCPRPARFSTDQVMLAILFLALAEDGSDCVSLPKLWRLFVVLSSSRCWHGIVTGFQVRCSCSPHSPRS